ncbi:MAG: Fe(2+) transporter permease subunit FeoB [Hydrogenovibrio sp.]
MKPNPASRLSHKLALIGSPNCGKTTLFNRLTGANQTTGNWPGVTVSKKTGAFEAGHHAYQLTDLPGIYSLENSSRSGLDEQVARDFLQNEPLDLLINVVDVTCLERQLFLTTQLLHMGLPVVVVLNRMDRLDDAHLKIDIEALSKTLGCPVLPVSAYFNRGIDTLIETLPSLAGKRQTLHFDLPEALHHAIHSLKDRMPPPQQKGSVEESCWLALQYLIAPQKAPIELQAFAQDEKNCLETLYQEDLALIAADLYFQHAHEAAHASLTRTDAFSRDTTSLIDHWALHPWLGLPIFLAVMYAMFALSITIGNVFSDFFDQGAQAMFVDGPAYWLNQVHTPEWIIIFLTQGIGAGLQVVAPFIPVIGGLFLLLTLLEESGYMQRAALVMDRLMRRLGLSGQAFIPLVVGFGCNIPAVMATRSLPEARVRIATVMMTPFMSCSARLTVYMLFATAFFADYATLLVFSLYLIGLIAAVVTALLLKHTLLQGETEPLLMELPTYNRPSLMNIGLNTYNKLKGFIFGAGKVIVIVVMAINLLNSLGTDGTFGNENQSDSVLSTLAKTASPVVAPLGVTEDNWPATVGLITGILAKEVVVGSLNALYQSMDESPASATEPDADYRFWDEMAAAVYTIPENLGRFVTDFTDPLGLEPITSSGNSQQAADHLDVNVSTLEKMEHHFGGAIAAYAYLLLVLLYFPCVATYAAIKNELGWRWANYSALWSLLLGYSVAVSFYQLMTFSSHPTSSLAWVIFFALGYLLLFLLLKRIGRHSRGAVA